MAEQISSYSIPDSGGVVLEPGGPTEPAGTGYARIHRDDSNTEVSGFAIFGLRQDNVLVSETSVAAAGLLTTARVYAEINSPGTTGLAIANPNAEPAVLNFYFTDSAGTDFGQGSVTIPPLADSSRVSSTKSHFRREQHSAAHSHLLHRSRFHQWLFSVSPMSAGFS